MKVEVLKHYKKHDDSIPMVKEFKTTNYKVCRSVTTNKNFKLRKECNLVELSFHEQYCSEDTIVSVLS